MAFRVYRFHDLVDVLVDNDVTAALQRSIDFQIGHFRDDGETTAPWRIEVLPYERAADIDADAATRFHVSRALTGGFLDMPPERAALRKEPWGYTLFLQGGSGLLMVALQLLLHGQGVSLVHAGALCDRSGAVILLPGAGGVGKTALIAQLVRAGHGRLLGDDIVALTDTERALAVPRDFVLKGYHRKTLPDAFASVPPRPWHASPRVRRVLGILYRNAPFVGVTLGLLSRAGLLDGLLARLRPPDDFEALPVSSLFGPSAVAAEGPLRAIVFLERYDGNVFRFEPLGQKALVRRMFSILHHEWVDHMRAFWQLGAVEVVDLPSYFAEMARILEAATAAASSHLLRIPEAAAPSELTRFFLEKVPLQRG
jgi:hypothetical protein